MRQQNVSLGLWSRLASPHLASLLGASGADWVALDAQHGTWSDSALTLTLGLTRRRVPYWVRVLDDNPAGIGRVLDAGADMVVVPMVETREQAAAVAAACRYPPRGSRSFGPMAALAGVGDGGEAGHGDGDNDGDKDGDGGRPGRGPTPTSNPTCAVMIETGRALAQVDEIAAVDGVDMLFVGPFDLALSLGGSVSDLLSDTAPTAPLPRVVAACRSAGVRAGAYAGDIDAGLRLLELGFQDVAVATDASLLSEAATTAVSRVRRGPVTGE